ncbi:hypothetical protein VNO80_00176 [Phaseolus coccineus]|uniref:Uncharacterized protein n=1 Tax=Phaseolus coccineus TaxID=3886 RepID=A0AAN9NYC2_PHACN
MIVDDKEKLLRKIYKPNRGTYCFFISLFCENRRAETLADKPNTRTSQIPSTLESRSRTRWKLILGLS